MQHRGMRAASVSVAAARVSRLSPIDSPSVTSSDAAASLLLTIQRLTKRNELDEAVRVADKHWDEMKARDACVEDAESCRLTMLACLDLGRREHDRHREAVVWRVRAVARAAALGWGELIMALSLPDVLGIVRDANPSAETLTSMIIPDAALTAWEEALPFLELDPTAPRHPDGPILARLYWEKRGFMLCARREYAVAIESYDRALEFTAGTERGMLKVKLGRALCVYLRDTEGRTRAVTDTAELLRRCREVEQLQLAEVAERNLAVMHVGGRDVFPYELI